MEEDGKRGDEGRNAALVRGFKCDIAEDSVAQTQIQIQIQEIQPNTYISLIIVIEDRRNVTVLVGFKCDIAESIIPHSDDRQTQTHTNELACVIVSSEENTQIRSYFGSLLAKTQTQNTYISLSTRIVLSAVLVVSNSKHGLDRTICPNLEARTAHILCVGRFDLI